MKRGKKYQAAAELIKRGNLYDKAEAIELVKKAAVAKFDETIEAHIRTGCDGRHADQQIRGAVVLPHGTGKTVRILVFAKDAKAEEANYTRTNRSIHFMKDLKSGHKIKKSDIGILRTEKILSVGISPEFYDKVLGKKLKVDVKDGEGLLFEHLK
jgi:ribosomal protein L1